MNFGDVLDLYPKKQPQSKFTIIGLTANPHFQKCRFLAEKLHNSFPERYSKPEVRAMLNADWDEYLTKMKRRQGAVYHQLVAPVVVFVDGKFLGGAEELEKKLTKNYSFNINLDFEEVANQELIKYFENVKRNFVYLTVSIDGHIMGSMLFMLYNDIVPITCDSFLEKCDSQTCQIQRIARPSWIQTDGWNLENHPENYAIPHNRRGILSTCNIHPLSKSGQQFLITLDETPWMDYKYVAFGQLVQGVELLTRIEEVPTYYEKPLQKIKIVKCGQFSLDLQPDEDYSKAVDPSFQNLFAKNEVLGNVDSVLNFPAYQAGRYCLKTDLQWYYSEKFQNFFQNLETAYGKAEEELDDEKVEGITKQKVGKNKMFYFRDKHVII